jgi:hypothetical protein
LNGGALLLALEVGVEVLGHAAADDTQPTFMALRTGSGIECRDCIRAARVQERTVAQPVDGQGRDPPLDGIHALELLDQRNNVFA